MDFKPGGDSANQAGQAKILDDHGIDTSPREIADRGFEFLEFAWKGQGIEGDVTLDASLVKLGHDCRQVRAIEVRGAGASVVPLEPEVNGIRAILYRGGQTKTITSRGQKLGFLGATF